MKQATVALWAVTGNGALLAERIAGGLPGCRVFLPGTLAAPVGGASRFDRLKTAVQSRFHAHRAHVFVMSAGIAVRMIAPLITDKTKDPAVLVADEKGRHVISLLSGHIGGANALTLEVARIVGADPVITTATDLNGVPAVDVLAVERGLRIENPAAIKAVSRAVLAGSPVMLHDPGGLVAPALRAVTCRPFSREKAARGHPGIFVGDGPGGEGARVLVLRPPSLVAGIGCNRNTGVAELHAFLTEVLDRFRLAPGSLARLASIDLKADEAGLLALGERLTLPIDFYAREALNAVTTIQNPSTIVEKHVGAKSVCEAAAILGSRGGTLIVPKQNTPNVTVAIARIASTSSASGRGASTT